MKRIFATLLLLVTVSVYADGLLPANDYWKPIFKCGNQACIQALLGINTNSGGSVPTNISNGNFMLKTNSVGIGTATFQTAYFTNLSIWNGSDINQSIQMTMIGGDDIIFQMQHVTAVSGITTGVQFLDGEADFFTDLLGNHGVILNEAGVEGVTVRSSDGNLITLSGGNVLFTGVASGKGSGLSNAVNLVAGSNITITTNANGRAFTIASTSSGSVNGTNLVTQNQTNYGTLNHSNQTTSINAPLETFNTLTNSDSSPAYYRVLNASAPGKAGRFIEWEEQSTFNGVVDVVHGIGRNMKQNGVLDNTNFPAEAEIIEQKYANQNNHAQIEWYHVYVDQNGNISRFMTYTANATNFASTEDTRVDINGDGFHFARSTNGAPEVLAFDRNNFTYSGVNLNVNAINTGTNQAMTMKGDTSVGSGANGWRFEMDDTANNSNARNVAMGTGNRVGGYGRWVFGISLAANGDPLSDGQYPLVLTATAATVNGSFSNSLINTSTGGYRSASSNLLTSTSITVGASPFSYTNTLTKNIFIYVDGLGATASCSKNGQQLFASIASADWTVPLQPGQYVTITYSLGTPVMRFDPL